MRANTILKKLLGPTQTVEARAGRGAESVTIRYADGGDADALAELAVLDSNRAPRGVVLLADVHGQPWAAVSLDDGHAVANPFRPSGELLFLLGERARQLRSAEQGRMERLPRVWPPAPLERSRAVH